MSNAWRDFNKQLIKDLRAHGGKASSGPFRGSDVLILTTRGARSGELRENPLAYSSDNGYYVVIASRGGSPRHPAWYHNLVANPDVTVEVLGDRFAAHAKVVEGEEYERLYRQHASRMPAFNEYRRRTSRKIPVIVLEKVEPKPTG
ncbi:MAG TPA: nitroreductase family deazaflavin-dependent oxidoreductase [Candidatus Dormibacteraeota bacterium]|nr:nitroreductase family deazaflavin-dependent oxidoreductase [Candidatus Dormibacteraeota bacterium]